MVYVYSGGGIIYSSGSGSGTGSGGIAAAVPRGNDSGTNPKP